MALSLTLLAVLCAAPPQPTSIAVLDFEAAGIPKELAETASLLVPTEVRSAVPHAQVTSGAEIKSMIGFERQKQLMGCADDSPSCMAELGGALGADELVTGKIGLLGTSYVLELRRIDVKLSRPIKSVTQVVKRDTDLISAISLGVAQLYGVSTQSSPARDFAWIPAVGAGLAGAVSAYGLVSATDRHNQLLNGSRGDSAEQLRDSGRALQTVGNVALGVAVLAAATAVALYVFGAPEAPAGEAKVIAGAFELTAAGVRW